MPLEGDCRFPCCGGHVHPHRVSALGYQVHPDADRFVAQAALSRDQGKQPAEILRELLDVFGEEPPAEPPAHRRSEPWETGVPGPQSKRTDAFLGA